MKQTILAEQERPLLSYAISKFNPDIFSHPVWIRFGRPGITHALAIAGELVSTAQRIEKEDPGGACQVLLASAVYQNMAGQNDMALETIGHVLDLAKAACFSSGALWAHWGACAVLFQQKNFEQAARQLEELEAILTELNEWVLADFVNVIKQAMYQPEIVSTWRQADISDGPSANDLVHFTGLALQGWGFSFQAPDPDGGSKWGSWYARDFFNKWRRKWNGPIKGGRELSVWQSIRSLLRLQEYDKRSAPESAGEAIPLKTAEIIPEPIPSEGNHNPVVDIPATVIPSPKPKGAHKRKSSPSKKPDRIALTVQMLGSFSISIGDTSPKLPASRALSVFKYLLLHHKQNNPREVLMDIFWPDAGLEAARNNLNVAMHNLRQALHKITNLAVIRFEDGAYGLASNIDVWLDVDEFEHCFKEGQWLEAHNQLTTAMAKYEIAANLYGGDFLVDSPYDGWTVFDRERLRIAYLDTLDHLSQIYFSQELYVACSRLCQIILNYDLCREDAHCRLMQCYSRLGQGPLALRQYQICVDALRSELGIDPASETTRLYERIRQHEQT